jgi:ribosomal protein S18 acetylase RimI-like enzyme
MAIPGVSLRPARPEDEQFLLRVYASTRIEELAQVPWTEAERDAFLRMQFTAQHHYYLQHYASGEFLVILVGGEPAGPHKQYRGAAELRIVDISLLPEFRGKGIGRALLADILEEGDRAGLPVRIHVERNNPALRLYRELGFRAVGEVGVYDFMERLPVSARAVPSPPRP